MDWTKDQLKAINEEGTNIIISAGAGSGKTAVLTERVYRKLQSGINITNLLVLTFTNAAAASMKEKIRKRIKKEPSLKNQLELIDSAYICTFDSFSLALVKKYHTYLNITNNIEITDKVIIDLEKKRILTNILEEKYSNPSNNFKLLINNFCLKDDDKLIDNILKVYDKIELKYDKEEYLNNYLKEAYKDELINQYINDYLDLVLTHIDNINIIIEDIESNFEGKTYTKIYDSVSNILNLRDYDSIKLHINNVELPRISKYQNTHQKALKESLKKEIDSLKELCIYDSLEEAKEELLSTKSNVEEIINILIELHSRLTKYKFNNNVFNFNDIAHLAIKIIKENDDIRNELKNTFNEILIDEYQDTSDTQEEFISLISNNNVYMVGDIKQSIYRFRNANPYIFKDKYDLYQDTDKGIKIDLLENFRSRKEVLENINEIFNRVMSDDIGGADYPISHNMVFGNLSYEKEGKKDNNNLEILNYELENKKYTNSEYEAFIIAKDIINRVSNTKVFDKDDKVLRNSNYSDFCIMIDRSKDFDLYKEIFTYFGIPLSIIQDDTLTKDNDIYVISNLIKLIIKVKQNVIDTDFIHSFISIARSYLYGLSDKDIYDIYINNSYKETDIYNKCLELTKIIDNVSPEDFYEEMIKVFNYEEKLITVGNIDSYIVKEEYIYNLIRGFSNTGKTIYDFSSYLDDIFENELDISFKSNSDSTNTVKIMTIHKSKGLEFPICYYSGFSSKFNLPEFKERIYFDNNYGIILPKVDKFYKDTILKTITKKKGLLEDISERIRLLYVALTRAEEKMIIVLPKSDEESTYQRVPDYIKEKYSSFEKILSSINLSLDKYKQDISINLTKDYKLNKKELFLDKLLLKEDNLVVSELSIESNPVESKHYSKESLKLNTKEEKQLLEFGTKVHEILELIDFNNYDLSLFNIDDSIKEKINNFINTDLIQSNIDNKMYKEYEFIYQEDNIESHGIIDLLIETNNKFIIIDYKLKNIDDELYDKQLNGYRSYIKNKTNKDVDCYLYSIMDEKYRKVD